MSERLASLLSSREGSGERHARVKIRIWSSWGSCQTFASEWEAAVAPLADKLEGEDMLYAWREDEEERKGRRKCSSLESAPEGGTRLPDSAHGPGSEHLEEWSLVGFACPSLFFLDSHHLSIQNNLCFSRTRGLTWRRKSKRRQQVSWAEARQRQARTGSPNPCGGRSIR